MEAEFSSSVSAMDVETRLMWAKREQELAAREAAVERREQQLLHASCKHVEEIAVDSNDDNAKGSHSDCYWSKGKYIKSLVFGALDGLTTSLAFIASAVAAGESNMGALVVLIVGVSQLVGDAFSMGLGDYLSSLAERDVCSATEPHAHYHAVRNGMVMFVAFILFGAVPLCSYLPLFNLILARRFYISCILCVACLFILGCIKGKLEGSPLLRAGMIMVTTGGIASVMSYYCSVLINNYIDPQHQPGLAN